MMTSDSDLSPLEALAKGFPVIGVTACLRSPLRQDGSMTTRNTPLHLTGDPAADALLSQDANALLIGMVLDQQVTMEKAFAGPAVIAQRMGGVFDVAAIAALNEEEFVALCSKRPAIHRFPAAGEYGEDGVFRSVADIVDAESLVKVRETKRAAKAEAKKRAPATKSAP